MAGPAPTEIEVATTKNYDTKMWRDVDESLEKAGVPKDAPGLGQPPAEQPVLAPPLAKTIGAVNVGHEDSDVGANIENAMKIARSTITGESVWARLGKAIRGAKIWNRRNIQLAQTEKKIDPEQMDQAA